MDFYSMVDQLLIKRFVCRTVIKSQSIYTVYIKKWCQVLHTPQDIVTHNILKFKYHKDIVLKRVNLWNYKQLNDQMIFFSFEFSDFEGIIWKLNTNLLIIN